MSIGLFAASRAAPASGSAAAVLPQLQAAATGTAVAPVDLDGSAAVVLPQLVADATGTSVSFTSGTVAVVLPQLTVAGTGEAALTGVAAVLLPLLTVDGEASAREDYESAGPASFDQVVGGAFRYWAQLKLDDLSTSVTFDHIDGSYRFDGGRVSQRTLQAEVFVETAAHAAQLDVAAMIVRPTVSTGSMSDLSDQIDTNLVPLWLDTVRKQTDDLGTRYQIEAVCILGRLARNGLTGPVQPAATVIGTIERILNSCGHHRWVTVEVGAGVSDQAAAQDAVFTGDPIAACAELAEQIGAMLVSIGWGQVKLVATPTVDDVHAYLAENVVSYQTVVERSPTRVVVESSSTDGTLDVTAEAGGAGPGDYGTVTYTATRPVASESRALVAASALLRRVGALGYQLREVQTVPNPGITFGRSVKVDHSGADTGVVWSYDLPLSAERPMRLQMRTPEDP